MCRVTGGKMGVPGAENLLWRFGAFREEGGLGA